MAEASIFVLSNGEEIPVVIENRRGAHNVTLRPKIGATREIHISKPWMTSTSFVLKFLESKRKWVEKIFDAAPKKEKIIPGMTIEFLGRNVTLQHNANARGNCYANEDKIGRAHV